MVHSKPLVISALGAIPKDDGKVRIIHDLSRPNMGVNQFGDSSSCSYLTIDHATGKLPKNGFMSKVDLRAAYRSVPIHPRNYGYMGLSWIFGTSHNRTFMTDTRLPFGSKKAC